MDWGVQQANWPLTAPGEAEQCGVAGLSHRPLSSVPPHLPCRPPCSQQHVGVSKYRGNASLPERNPPNPEQGLCGSGQRGKCACPVGQGSPVPGGSGFDSCIAFVCFRNLTAFTPSVAFPFLLAPSHQHLDRLTSLTPQKPFYLVECPTFKSHKQISVTLLHTQTDRHTHP